MPLRKLLVIGLFAAMFTTALGAQSAAADPSPGLRSIPGASITVDQSATVVVNGNVCGRFNFNNNSPFNLYDIFWSAPGTTQYPIGPVLYPGQSSQTAFCVGLGSVSNHALTVRVFASLRLVRTHLLFGPLLAAQATVQVP